MVAEGGHLIVAAGVFSIEQLPPARTVNGCVEVKRGRKPTKPFGRISFRNGRNAGARIQSDRDRLCQCEIRTVDSTVQEDVAGEFNLFRDEGWRKGSRFSIEEAIEKHS